jgi:hypothetical protein
LQDWGQQASASVQGGTLLQVRLWCTQLSMVVSDGT